MLQHETSGHPSSELSFYKGETRIDVCSDPLKYRLEHDATTSTFTLMVADAGEEDAGVYWVRAAGPAGQEASVRCRVELCGGAAGGDLPPESNEDPFVKLNIIDVTTSESGSDTEDDLVETSKKKLLQLIEDEPDLSVIEEEHSGAHSEFSSDGELYAPRVEIVPEPVTVKEGETIRLATKVTGQQVH